MKYAKKLMVVPFVKKLENPSEKFLENLDSEMTKILYKTNLSVDEKVKLYHATLNRFKVNYEPNAIGTNNNLSSLLIKLLENKQAPELLELSELLNKNLSSSSFINNESSKNESIQNESVKNELTNDISMATEVDQEDPSSSPMSVLTKHFNEIPTKVRKSFSNLSNPFGPKKINPPSPINRSGQMQSNIINDSNDSDFNTINTPKVDGKNINTRRSSKNKLVEPLSYKYRQDNLQTLNNVIDLDKNIPKWDTKKYF